MNQITGTTPTDAPTQAQDDSQPADAAGSADRSEIGQPGFGSRGRMRRRARFLHKARELAYRDLGGLVFNLHRFGQRNDALVLAKLNTLGHIDAELRTLEDALEERVPVTVLREAGITACARCAAIHSSEDRFCPNCGLSMARNVDLPIAGAASSPAPPAPATPATSPPPAASPPSAAVAAPAASPPPPAPARPAAAESAPDVAAAPAPSASDGASAPVPARRSESPPTGAAPAAAPPGRSPAPPQAPEPAPSSASAESAGGEERTEIIRPGAPGS